MTHNQFKTISLNLKYNNVLIINCPTTENQFQPKIIKDIRLNSLTNNYYLILLDDTEIQCNTIDILDIFSLKPLFNYND